MINVNNNSTNRGIAFDGFGKRLKEARKLSGKTQDDLAPNIGVTKNTLSRYEREDIEPTATVIALISVVLGISADWLLTGEGQMYRGDWGVMPSISAEEQRLVHTFQKLPPEEKRAVELIIDRLACFADIRKPEL
ncbi:MAG TPA: XRE family transcriptional regulator [Gammaproteobacteria bacterium]|nr:XRE family transcriptional regulator [Gammaproteobacteria bacterium]